MAKAIWKGNLSFGLVEIPVGLFPADDEHSLDLTMLDRHDFAPIGYKRFNKRTQKEVEWKDIVRGYEHEKGEYVVLTDAELRNANPAITQTAQIVEFVDAADIEPIFYEKPYYLAPLSKQGKGYALLRETLKRTRTVGIARIAVRTREHLAAVGVRGNALILHLLRFAAEVRSPSDVPGVDAHPRLDPKELAMAARLVASMKDEWKPERFKDQYSRDVLALVAKKVKSGDIHALRSDAEDTERRPRAGKIIDLMPLLRQSLASTRRAETSKANERGGRSRGTTKMHRGPTQTVRARRRAIGA
jgi:DNA end-binding protein Ku